MHENNIAITKGNASTHSGQELRINEKIELIVRGFDGSGNDTDDLVIVVAAADEAIVEQFIDENQLSWAIIGLCELPPSSNADFALPSDADALKSRIADKAARNPIVLKDYRVSLRDETGVQSLIHFECKAEEADHASEQAKSAYPNGKVLQVRLIAEGSN
ncbi:hypothetical protein [Azonexus hydrophilus]|uniref:Uncharacterized protein n=1 Tax=Azonexus hydrophilus TaxID=418702 RepID=A0ABZ2XKY7_9RHOO